MPTMRASSTVTVRLQVSGQSRGQTLACSVFIACNAAVPTRVPSSERLARSSSQDPGQPGTDVADLHVADGVRHRVLVPLDAITEAAQDLRARAGARQRDE